MPKIITTKEFAKRIWNKFGNEYTLLSEYQGRHKHIHIQHECGYDWWPEAGSFISGNTHCKKCRVSDKRKTDSEFIEEIKPLVGTEYVPLTEYETAKDNILMFHADCGKTYYVTPDNFLRGRRCPYCNQSDGERMISDYLELIAKLSFLYNYHYEGLLYDMHFDFWIPSLRTVIEYDGRQHFESIKLFGGDKKFIKQQYHDRWKDNFCKEHNIKMIRISYKVKTLEQVKQILSTKLKVK